MESADDVEQPEGRFVLVVSLAIVRGPLAFGRVVLVSLGFARRRTRLGFLHLRRSLMV
jgi:hypothetical protein